jgi:hypothetical protein
MSPETQAIIQTLVTALISVILTWLGLKAKLPTTPEPVKPNVPEIPGDSPARNPAKPLDSPLLNVLILPLVRRLLGLGGGVFGASVAEEDAAVAALIGAIKSDESVAAKIKAGL